MLGRLALRDGGEERRRALRRAHGLLWDAPTPLGPRADRRGRRHRRPVQRRRRTRSGRSTSSSARRSTRLRPSTSWPTWSGTRCSSRARSSAKGVIIEEIRRSSTLRATTWTRTRAADVRRHADGASQDRQRGDGDGTTRDTLLDFSARLYEPSRMVVGVSGRVGRQPRPHGERLLGDLVEPRADGARPAARRTAACCSTPSRSTRRISASACERIGSHTPTVHRPAPRDRPRRRHVLAAHRGADDAPRPRLHRLRASHSHTDAGSMLGAGRRQCREGRRRGHGDRRASSGSVTDEHVVAARSSRRRATTRRAASLLDWRRRRGSSVTPWRRGSRGRPREPTEVLAASTRDPRRRAAGCRTRRRRLYARRDRAVRRSESLRALIPGTTKTGASRPRSHKVAGARLKPCWCPRGRVVALGDALAALGYAPVAVGCAVGPSSSGARSRRVAGRLPVRVGRPRVTSSWSPSGTCADLQQMSLDVSVPVSSWSSMVLLLRSPACAIRPTRTQASQKSSLRARKLQFRLQLLAGGRSDRARLSESFGAFRDVFAEPQSAPVELAWTATQLGRFAYFVALAVYAFDQGGATAVALVAVVRLVPVGVAAPFTSILGDRYPRKRVMFADEFRSGGHGRSRPASSSSSDGPAVAVYALVGAQRRRRNGVPPRASGVDSRRSLGRRPS